MADILLYFWLQMRKGLKRCNLFYLIMKLRQQLLRNGINCILGIQIIQGSLNTGFELPLSKLVVITEEEIFNKKTRKSKRRQNLSNAEEIKSYSELKIGDYVVHVNHGIGKYLGIETLLINGFTKIISISHTKRVTSFMYR